MLLCFEHSGGKIPIEGRGVPWVCISGFLAPHTPNQCTIHLDHCNVSLAGNKLNFSREYSRIIGSLYFLVSDQLSLNLCSPLETVALLLDLGATGNCFKIPLPSCILLA